MVLLGVLRSLKYVVGASAGGGTLALLHNNDWDVSTFGVVRFGRTALTVGAIAADYKWTIQGMKDLSEAEVLQKYSGVHQRSAERLLSLCCSNGGVFIKVGQHIGALDYVVPPEYCSTLKVLHSKAPRSSLEDVKRVVKEDLGQSVDELFSEFEESPRGTASLAQVHKAVLRETGQVVAVKVQHRRVKKHSLVDMATMDLLVRFVAKVFPEFSFMWLAEEMKRNLPCELDFIHESRNAEKVSRSLSHLSWLRIPTINWPLTTTRVLTMEFLDGGEVTDKDYVKSNKLNTRTIAERLATLYSEMIFIEGFVHCDPHPGNILVKHTSNGPEIQLLDHGLYVTLPEKFRYNYSNLWISIINADHSEIRKWAQEMGAGDLYPLLACILTSKPWEQLIAGLTKPGMRDEKSKKAEKEQLRKDVVMYFPQIANILARVNREMLLVLKTNDLLRGIEESLGTRGERMSLINMSRYCVRSVYDRQIENGANMIARLRSRFRKHWILAKISCYQFYLWLYYSLLGPAYR